MSLPRRAFLKGSAISLVGLGVAGAGPVFLRRAAWASEPKSGAQRKILVTIFQRGAMDGLMAVPPLDRDLRGPLDRWRPTLGMSAARSAGEGRVLDLGVGFGLHPSFESLLPAWKDGSLGIVHAVGSPDPTRSHFDAQDYMESGTPGRKATPSGWLDRVVGELGHEAIGPAAGASALRAVSMTDTLPRSLQGESGAVAIASLEKFRIEAGDQDRGSMAPQRRPRRSMRRPTSRSRSAEQERRDEVTRKGFERLYGEAPSEALREAGAETFEAVDALAAIDPQRYSPRGGANYPRSPLGQSLRQIAQLIRADVGLEIAFAESGGWDTHVRQGTDQGSFARRSRDLADSMAAFWTDLGALRSNVLLMTMTEFGRTVEENGSVGTDHGRASCMFVLGDSVDGGKIHGPWPGLAKEQLYEGRDLQVATDFRSVFAEVAAGHLEVGDLASVFPGFSGERLRLLRT